jgi:hypothetical protein
MFHCKYKSDFGRFCYSEGWKVGFKQGLEERWKEVGREKGLANLRFAVLALVRAKVGDVSDGELTALKSALDLDILVELIVALDQTQTPVDARAAFHSVCAGLGN